MAPYSECMEGQIHRLSALRPALALSCILILTLFGSIACKAAPPERDNDGDQYQRAIRYENAEGVPRDFSRALQLYCEAAARGDARAYLNLGWMYANGRGVLQNDGIAVGWWRKAALAGIPQGRNLLDLLPDVVPSTKLGCNERQVSSVNPNKGTPALHALIKRFASSSGLDDRLVTAIIAVESGFNPAALSPRHAMGLMQLMPATAVRFGVKRPFDPEQNIKGGTEYLAWLLLHYHGDIVLALAGYNAGENCVDSYGGVPPFAETIAYIARIRSVYPNLEALRATPGQYLNPSIVVDVSSTTERQGTASTRR